MGRALPFSCLGSCKLRSVGKARLAGSRASPTEPAAKGCGLLEPGRLCGALKCPRVRSCLAPTLTKAWYFSPRERICTPADR